MQSQMCLDYKKMVPLILTVFWMAVIFWFSSAPADESGRMSLSAGRLAARLLVPGYEEWSPRRQDAFAEQIDYPVRKTAHAGEYAALGMLMYSTVSGYFAWSRKRRGITAWLAAAAYAASDEFHQLFVPGRSGQISDVLLDGAGAAAGILLCMLAALMFRRCCSRRSQ